MNQTEIKGVDKVSSVHALFPSEKISIRLIDNFNTNRSKMSFFLPSNMTLYQFRS